MASIAIERSLAAEYFAGREAMELDVATVFQLVRALDGISPGFGDIADVRVLVAVDGVMVTDWGSALTGGSQVLLIPRVGGGQAG